MEISFAGIVVVFVVFLIWFWNSLYIIKEWERGVVLRLGRLLPQAKGAGLNLVSGRSKPLPHPLRIETLDVPPQDIITRDNVSVKSTRSAISAWSTPTWRSRKCKIITTRLRSSRKPPCAASSANSS